MKTHFLPSHAFNVLHGVKWVKVSEIEILPTLFYSRLPNLFKINNNFKIESNCNLTMQE